MNTCSRSEQDTQDVSLGVLLVHGIGTQHRGDTLLQAGDALQDWLRRWLPPIGENDVRIVNTDVAPAAPDPSTPAHARVVLPSSDKRASGSWLLAECHWADSFRLRSYGEFLNWAWRVVPWAVLLHLGPRFRRFSELFYGITTALENRQASPEMCQLFLRQIGRRPMEADGVISGVDLAQVGIRLFASMVATSFSAIWLSISGLLLLVVLSFLRLLSFLLPFEAVRQVALNAQLRLSATIGDSSVYLSSPLTASAIRTRLNDSLNWLAKRCNEAGCEQIVILAHSQGAAVAYDAIEQQLSAGRPDVRITHLITYGQGLRKLFDLRAAQRKASKWTFYGYVAFGLSILLTALAMCLLNASWALLTDFSLRALGVAALFLLLVLLVFLGILGVLLAASDSSKTNPTLLGPESEFGGPEWVDLYASHDPVPNGPLEVSDKGKITPACLRFYERQREVTNRRSILSDHTSYWECPDDFVARIGNLFLELSWCGGRRVRLLRAWIDVAAERRRWRVQVRNGFCWATAFVGLMAVLTSRVIVENVDASRQIFGGLNVEFFGLISLAIPPLIVPDWLFRMFLMVGALAIALFVAERGFKLWEWYECQQFFNREGYRLVTISVSLVSAGWIVLIASIPTVTLLSGQEAALRFDAFWPSLSGLITAAFTLWWLRAPPGTHKRWALQLLQMGEELLRDTNADRASLDDAKAAFEASHKILKGFEHKEAERAERCLTDVKERLAILHPSGS